MFCADIHIFTTLPALTLQVKMQTVSDIHLIPVPANQPREYDSQKRLFRRTKQSIQADRDAASDTLPLSEKLQPLAHAPCARRTTSQPNSNLIELHP